MLLVCYSLLTIQNMSINNSKKRVGYLLTRTLPAQLKKAAEIAQNNRPMVSFIHNGSEITTWMGYSFKTKNIKSKTKQHFKDKNIFFESKAADN